MIISFARSLFVCSLFIITNVHASGSTQVCPRIVYSSQRLGKIELHRDAIGFIVKQNEVLKRVKSFDVGKDLSAIPSDRMKDLERIGSYIALNQLSDGDFILELKNKGLGGGPVLGWIAYWVTKSVCYGTAAAAAGTVAVASGGLAGAAVGAGVAGATASLSTGATIVAGAIGGAGTGAAATAVTATAGTVAAAGGIAGAIAAVEGASLSVGAFFGMLPTP